MAKKKSKKKAPAKRKSLKRNTSKKKTIKKSGTKTKPKKARKKIRAKVTRKSSSKKTASKTRTAKGKGIIGTITHYFPHVQAAVIKLKEPLSVGDTIKIKGHTTDFTQTITSMQIDRVDIASAKPGQEIGLLVSSRVRHNDIVTKLQ